MTIRSPAEASLAVAGAAPWAFLIESGGQADVLQTVNILLLARLVQGDVVSIGL